MIETVVGVSIATVATTTILGGIIAAAHRFGPDPIREALEARVQSELRVAADMLKYQGASIAPNSVATSVPLPGGSPIPAHVSLATVTHADGSIGITITASADGSSESATAASSFQKPAPLPSANVSAGDADAPI